MEKYQKLFRRDGRAVEGAPLLREYGSKAHRGFESLSLRQFPEIKLSHKVINMRPWLSWIEYLATN